MFNGVLGFIHQKLDQGLHTGDDVFNDAVGAVHHLFSNPTPPQPSQGAQSTLRVNNQPNTQSIAVNQAMTPSTISVVNQPSPQKINLPAPANPVLPTSLNTPIAHPSNLSQIGNFAGSLLSSTIGQMGNTDPLAGRASPINKGGKKDAQLLSDEPKNAQQNLQGFGSTPYRIVGSIKNKPLTPGGALGVLIAGNKPVPTYQQISKQSGGLTAGLQAGMDALTATGAVRGGGDLVVKGAKTLNTVGVNTAIRAGNAPEAGFINLKGENVNNETPQQIEQRIGQMHDQQQGKTPTELPATIDKVMANTSKTGSPEVAQAERFAVQRSVEAERFALEHLQAGGDRQGAIKIYQQETGVNPKMAAYRVRIAAKESKTPLNTSIKTKNPLANDFKIPEAKVGEYERAPRNAGIVNNSIDLAGNRVLAHEKNMHPDDLANFRHYVEGTKPVSEAKNPALVQQAVKDARTLFDTAHALDANFSETPHIKDFFPGYLDHNDPRVIAMDKLKAEQQLEEEVGPEEWNKLSRDEKDQMLADRTGPQFSSEDRNYGGFRNKQKIFKNSAEAEAAGYPHLNANPFEDIRRYMNGAKLNIGNEAYKSAYRQAEGVLSSPGQRYAITLPGDDAIRVNKQAIKVLKNTGVRSPASLPKKILRGFNTSVVKTIVANPIFHGGNQEFNAVFQAAFRLKGNKISNMVKLVKNQVEMSGAEANKWRTEYYAKGGVSPDYAKNRYGFIAKGLEKAGIDPSVAELSPRGMAAIEQNIRVSLYKLGRERGMNPADTIRIIDKTLGGPEIMGDMASSVGLFLHYFTTNLKLLGDTGVQVFKGNLAPITGLAIGYGAYVAANKAWQEATGNKKASVRAPGILGVGLQIAKAPGQLRRGQVPTAIVNHTNPGITTLISGASNKDLHKPVYGPQANSNTIRGPKGEGFKSLAGGNLFGPGQTVQKIGSGKMSPVEAVLSLGLGAYTPHTKDQQASPNIRILNTPGAKPGNGIADRDNYFKAQNDGYKILGNNQKNIDTFNKYFDTERDPNNPNVILGRAPADTRSRWADLYANDSVRSAVQTMEKQLPNHDPIWDLSPDKLKTAINYESQYAGDPEKSRMAEQNPWLVQLSKDRSAFFDKQTYTGQYQPSPDTPPYPKLSTQTQSNLDAYSALTDSTQKSDFLTSHPDVIPAFNQIAQYTNQMRIAQGGLPLQPFPQESAHVAQVLNSMNGLTSREKGALIRGNPDVNQYLADVSLHDVTKNLAGYYLSINPNQTEGQELNNGSVKAQQTLKGIQSLGNYDIGKDPLTGQYSFLQNGSFPAGTSVSGSGGSKKKPLVPRPPRVKPKKLKLRKPRGSVSRKAKLVRTQKKITFKPSSGLSLTKVARPTSVLKIKA